MHALNAHNPTQPPPDFLGRENPPLRRMPPACASCESGERDYIYGADPDGFVLCRGCGSPLFYCDIGGQG